MFTDRKIGEKTILKNKKTNTAQKICLWSKNQAKLFSANYNNPNHAVHRHKENATAH